jgi:putative transposase
MVLKGDFIWRGNFHFVTFGCNGKRKLLSTPYSRQIVISVLSGLVKKNSVKVSAFAVMPDHVHAVLWFDGDNNLPTVMQVWKHLSAHYLIRYFEKFSPDLLTYLRSVQNGREITKIWTRKYYDYCIESEARFIQKLKYIHDNPVRKELVKKPEDYPWSSARFYSSGKSVGIKIDTGF